MHCFHGIGQVLAHELESIYHQSIVLNRIVMSGGKYDFSNSMKNFSENELTISLIPLGCLKDEYGAIWS